MLKINNGVRQGGMLSPVLFNLYVDTIITTLKKLEYGCHVNSLYLGCFFYADDLILLSASILELQRMLDTCSIIGIDLGLSFNAKCLMIGPNIKIAPAALSIDSMPLAWVDEIKYLGVWIRGGKCFDVDFAQTHPKFFVFINSILYHSKYSSELVRLSLIESHCLPLLLYGLECLNFEISKLKLISSWWNSVYGKLFGDHK